MPKGKLRIVSNLDSSATDLKISDKQRPPHLAVSPTYTAEQHGASPATLQYKNE